MNIGLLGVGFSAWGGGIDFLRFCANALALVCNDDTKLVILLPDPEHTTPVAKIRSFLSPYKRMATSILAGKRPVFFRNKAFSRVQLNDSFRNIDGNIEIIFFPPGEDLASVAARIEADVLIPSAFSLGSSFPVPWVGYLHDFQHKYHPDFFPDEEIKDRDAKFLQMLEDASAVVVNAAEVKLDIQRFFPQTECNVFDLPFSSTPIETWFEPPAEDLSQKYQLPKEYFIVCNQFWIHKDHATAFKALAKFTDLTGKQEIHIVCTGKTIDFGHPDYFSNLGQTITQLGLQDRIHFLGHIPKKDQIDIMCGSIAVLQPTLFEGGPGGGAVYDAVAMGVPAIVSDIQVNLEIEGHERLFFFKALDSDDLAQKMIEVQNMVFVKQDKNKLLSAGRERTKAYGLRLLEAIESVLSDGQ